MPSNQANTVLTRIDGTIATLSFNRPKALNAINVATAEAFLTAVHECLATPAVRVIVIKGNGRAFMAGGDLAEFKQSGLEAPQLSVDIIKPVNDAIKLLAAAPQIVLASVHGAVAGAGMSLAMAADLAIAADNTKFTLAYIDVANNPDCGGSWYLYQLLGLRKAMEIALLNERTDASEALRLGLVSRVVPADELEEQTIKLAQRLANCAPLAMASTKKLLRQAAENTLPEQLDAELTEFVNNAGSFDFREAITAFFDKRKPTFIGK